MPKKARQHKKKTSNDDAIDYKQIERQTLPHSKILDVEIPQFQYPELNGIKLSLNQRRKTTISELISEAEPCSTINIPAGTYNESLFIDKPLKIIANGDVKIVSSDSSPVVRISSDGVSLRGFEFSQRFDQEDVLGAVVIEEGSALLLECSIKSAACPTLLALNDSVINVNGCKFLSKKAPNFLAFGESKAYFELCNFHGSKSNGIVLRESSIGKFNRCTIQGFKKSGVVSCDNSIVFISKCRITACAGNGVELSTDCLCTIVDSSIEGCGECGIYAYNITPLRLSNSTIEGCMSCGLEIREGAAARLNGNVFSHCGAPAALYAFERATVDSLDDKFTSTGPLAIGSVENASVMMRKTIVEDISGRGAIVSDEATLNISESRFERTDETTLSCFNGGSLVLSQSYILSSGELGIILSNCHSTQITKSHIDSCALSGIEIRNVQSDLSIEECNFTRCRQCGIIAIDSTFEMSVSNSMQNCFSGIEFRSSKVTLCRCRSEDNSCGGICIKDGSDITVDTCIVQRNVQVGLSLETKSTMSIANSTIDTNKKLGIAVETESFLKLKSSIVTNHACVAIQIEGKNSRAFIDKCDLTENDVALICVSHGRVALKGTTSDANGMHMELRDKGQVKASSCKFIGGKSKAAINILAKGSASFDDCEISKNSGVGLACEGEVHMTTCQVFSNKIGSFIYGRSSGELSQSHFYKNGKCGIYVKEGSISIENNTIEDHEMYGISVESAAKPKIENNEMKNNVTKDIHKK